MSTRALTPRLLLLVALTGCAQPITAPTAAVDVLSTGPFAAGDLIALDGSDSVDTNDEPLALSWSWRLVSGPAGAEPAWTGQEMPRATVTLDEYGDYEVGLIVSNGWASSEELLTTLTIDACGNEPPVVQQVTADPPAPNTGQTLQLTAEVTDADTEGACALVQPQTWRWTILAAPAGSAASLNDPTLRDPSLRVDRPGTYQIELRVTDATGRTSDPYVFEVVASTCADAAPAVDDVEATPAEPMGGDQVVLTITSSDADNAIECGLAQTLDLRSAFVAKPSGSTATLAPEVGPTPAFVADLPGEYIVRTWVTDGTGRESTQDTTVVVGDCGVATPVVDGVGVVPAVPHTGSPVLLGVSVSDADNHTDGCDLAQDLDVQTRFLSRPAGSQAQLTPAEGLEPSFTPDVPGDYIVRTTVIDSTGRSSSLNTTVSVDVCGDGQPYIDAIVPSSTAPYVGDLVSFDVTANDPDNGTSCAAAQRLDLTTRFLQRPIGSTATLQPHEGATPAFIADMPGEYVLLTEVSDGTGRRATRETRVTVDPCGGNAPEILVPGTSPSSPTVGARVTLDVVTADEDNATCGLDQRLTARSAFTSKPAGSTATLTPAEGTSPSFVPDEPGTYTIRTWVEDDTGRASFVDTTVTVDACGSAAPTISALVQTPTDPVVGELVAFSVSATDNDVAVCGLSQTHRVETEWLSLPIGSAAQLVPALGSTPAFVPDMPGDYTIRTWVTDNTGHASAKDTTVTVDACGTARPVAQIETLSPIADGPDNALVLSGSVEVDTPVHLDASSSTDADIAVCGLPQVLTYAWSFVRLPAGSTARINDVQAENPSFTPDIPGEYVAQVDVSDGTQHQTATVTLTATPVSIFGVASGYLVTWVDGNTGAWNAPKGITVGASGEIYIVQSGDDTITVTNSTGNTSVHAMGGLLNGNSPEDIVYAPSVNQLFVTDTAQDRVIRIDASGNQSAATSGTLGNPRSISLFTPNGTSTPRLLVSDDSNSRIVFYPVATTGTSGNIGTEAFGGNLAGIYGNAAAVIGSTNTYYGVAWGDPSLWRTDTNNDVFVGDTVYNDIREVVRGPSGALYVADAGAGRVLRVQDCTSNCTPSVTVVASGTWEPWGLAIESNTTLLVTDRAGDALYRITNTSGL